MRRSEIYSSDNDDNINDSYKTLLELARNAIFKDVNGVYVRYKREKYYIKNDSRGLYFIVTQQDHTKNTTIVFQNG